VPPRRTILKTHRLARLLNLGLVATGLAVLVALATGGARLRFGDLVLGPWGAAVPACLFFLFAAVRLGLSRRSSGVEGWIVTFYARQGLPPRDAPTSLSRALRTGFLLGAGAGVVVAAAEVTVLLGRTAAPGIERYDAFLLALVELVTGIVVPGLLGTGIAAAIYLAGRWGRGRSPGGYELGRRVVIGLLLLLPPLLLLGPRPGTQGPLPPRVLLGAMLAMVLAAIVVFLVLPAAWLRAREGRWGLAVVAGGGAAVLLGLLAVSRFAGGGAPVARVEEPPANVLLVTLTGLRTDHTRTWHGAEGFTPFLDGLAATGTVFREPVSPSSWPPAAAASLLTGLYPEEHGLVAPGDRLHRPVESLPRVLAAHGWVTAAFVSSREFDGGPTGFAALFDEYRDTTTLGRRLRRVPLGRIAALAFPPDVEPRLCDETAAALRDWIIRRGAEPWFAWVELADPWRPHPRWAAEPPPPGEVAGGGARGVLDPPPAWALPVERRASLAAWRRAYDGAVKRTDQVLEGILRSLGAWGLERRTLVVVTGEAGVTLGEDGTWFGMGSSLPEPVVHRPLLFAGSGVTNRRSLGGPCSLVDVMPTILGVLQLEPSRHGQGEDLSRYLLDERFRERNPRSGPVFSECPLGPGGAHGLPPRVVSVRIGFLKLVRWPDGRQELRLAGAGEERPVPPNRPRALRELEAQLDQFLDRSSATRR